MRPVRRVALLLTVATSVAIAVCGPAVAHEMAPTTAAPIASPKSGVPLSPVATAVALLVLVAVAAVLLARRRRRPDRAHAAAVALVFTGVVHCALAPSHWAEGWPLGLFFVGSGIVLLGQAAAVWKRPSTRTYVSVLASTAVLIALYFVARQGALPLVDHQDPYRFEELPVKAAELVAGGLALAALLPRFRTAYGDGPWIAERSWVSGRASAPQPTRP